MTKVAKQDNTTVAIPAELIGGANLDGGESNDLIIPRLHMFQDTSQERENFGQDFKLGDLLDPIEIRKLNSNQFVPVCGFKSWVKIPEGSNRPDYIHRDKSLVPKEDLEWIEGANGKNIAPAATETLNYLVVVEGEDMPYLLRFHKTGYKAGKTLNTLEKRRGALKRGPGLYALEFTKESGTQGVYARVVLRAAGDPSSEMIGQAQEILNSFGADMANVKAADEASEEEVPI